MILSLAQLQALTTKLDNLDLVGDEVTEISFSYIHLNVVSFKLGNERKFYYFHINKWISITHEQFLSLAK